MIDSLIHLSIGNKIVVTSISLVLAALYVLMYKCFASLGDGPQLR
jgi:hypothetical protein